MYTEKCRAQDSRELLVNFGECSGSFGELSGESSGDFGEVSPRFSGSSEDFGEVSVKFSEGFSGCFGECS